MDAALRRVSADAVADTCLVSILVLVDAALRHDLHKNVLTLHKSVSILVLVDAALRLSNASYITSALYSEFQSLF